MKEAAKRSIWAQAKAVVLAARGKNEFESLEAARAKLDGMIEIAKTCGIFTDEEIQAIKAKAKTAL